MFKVLGQQVLKRFQIFALFIILMISGCASTHSINGKASLDSFSVYKYNPDKPGKYPAVLVLHTIGGLLPHVQDYARKISKHNYVALVVDYKSGTRARLGNFRRLIDAYNYLQNLPEVDPNRIGVVGFSLGARHAISLSSEVEPGIKAIVSYYVGRLNLIMPSSFGFKSLLFLHGEQDIETRVNVVNDFCERVIQSGKICEKEIYPGVFHAFDHRSDYGGNNPAVTKKAFTHGVKFLDAHLKY